jgi:hypothetical protein
MDTPWREQSQWAGDVAAVIVPAIYACFGDAALPGQFYRQAADAATVQGPLAHHSTYPDGASFHSSARGFGRVISNYSLWWIQGLWNHYLYTGEAAYIHEYYPTVQRIVSWYLGYLDRYGLLRGLPNRSFIDHCYRESHPGASAPLNAMFHGTLADVMGMAEMIGDRHTGDRLRTVRSTQRANFLAAFHDPEVGVLRNVHGDAGPAGGISEHANMAAICWRLVDDEAAHDLVRRVYVDRATDFVECEPFFAVVALRALRSLGYRDLALDLIRERWGHRMLAQGLVSCTEEWNASGSWRGPEGGYVGIFRSLSHAWSACPAEFLTADLIGLTIREPGCGTVGLDPLVTDFDYRVRYRTPRGTIGVSCRSGQVDIDIPEAVKVT